MTVVADNRTSYLDHLDLVTRSGRLRDLHLGLRAFTPALSPSGSLAWAALHFDRDNTSGVPDAYIINVRRHIDGPTRAVFTSSTDVAGPTWVDDNTLLVPTENGDLTDIDRVDVAHRESQFVAQIPVAHGLNTFAGRDAFGVGDYRHQYLVTLDGAHRIRVPRGWHLACPHDREFIVAKGGRLASLTWSPSAHRLWMKAIATITKDNVYQCASPR